MTSPLRSLAQGQPVLHWHGDTFDLPDGSTLLASTNQYPHQAFIYGEHGLALQFHIEASATGLERWYVGHTGELSAEGIDVNDLRTQGQVAAPTSNGVLFGIMDEFLGGLPPAN
jgi:GMP synthase (glutamine-hydrolysing)